MRVSTILLFDNIKTYFDLHIRSIIFCKLWLKQTHRFHWIWMRVSTMEFIFERARNLQVDRSKSGVQYSYFEVWYIGPSSFGPLKYISLWDSVYNHVHFLILCCSLCYILAFGVFPFIGAFKKRTKHSLCVGWYY
jgi:hypothetical protein